VSSTTVKQIFSPIFFKRPLFIRFVFESIGLVSGWLFLAVIGHLLFGPSNLERKRKRRFVNKHFLAEEMDRIVASIEKKRLEL